MSVFIKNRRNIIKINKSRNKAITIVFDGELLKFISKERIWSIFSEIIILYVSKYKNGIFMLINVKLFLKY
jgi:hypothetical protein